MRIYKKFDDVWHQSCVCVRWYPGNPGGLTTLSARLFFIKDLVEMTQSLFDQADHCIIPPGHIKKQG